MAIQHRDARHYGEEINGEHLMVSTATRQQQGWDARVSNMADTPSDSLQKYVANNHQAQEVLSDTCTLKGLYLGSYLPETAA